MRTLALAVAASLLAAAPAAAAETRNCGFVAFTPNSDDGAFNIRAKNTSCKTARRVARAAKDTGVTSGPKRFTARGFACRGRYDHTSLPTVHWRCVRDDAVVRFDRS